MRKNRIFNHFGLKVLAVILAIVTWVVVINIDDYTVSKTISDIPVEKINGQVLTELDKIYDVTKGDTVDIIVKGKRSIVEDLSADDFIATADLSQMSITSAVRIDIKPSNNQIEEELTITPIDNMLTLSLENKIEKQLVVTGALVGNEATGYKVGQLSLGTTVITVSGAESIISKISEVKVEINIEGLHSDLETTIKPVCYDAYGEIIPEGKYTISHDLIAVSAPVYRIKEVPVRVAVQGVLSNDYKIVEVSCQPDTVKVAGPSEELSSFNELVIDNISIGGKTSSIQETVTISDYLGNGIIDADVADSIVVNIIIEKKESADIMLDIDNIKMLNTSSEYEYGVILPEDFNVKIIGLKEKIEDINLSELNFRIDCSDLFVGNNQVEIIWNESENYEVVITGEITVTVDYK